MSATAYATPMDRIKRAGFFCYCGGVFVFLVAPILVIVPLSFNAGTFLTYPLAGLSLRWYADFVTSPQWLPSVLNSLLVATAATAIATPLGILAAVGLVMARSKLKVAITAALISPMIVPDIITAVAVYFFYAPLGLTSTYWGLILPYTVMGSPFVVIVVQAVLQGFDPNLIRAAASLGARPTTVLFRVVLPLIAPGVVTGAVFAFMKAFDETVIAIFVAGPAQRTLPLQMFDGIREQISPTITAAATLLVVVAIFSLTTLELLRRHNRRLVEAPHRATP